MRPLGLLLLLLASFVPARAGENISDMSNRLRVLELERNDYRKPTRGLPADKEKERLFILGWLYAHDPLWLLQEEITDQLNGLAYSNVNSEQAMKAIENRKAALALISDVATTTSYSPTEKDTGILRAYIVLGDIEALKAWRKDAKAQ